MQTVSRINPANLVYAIPTFESLGYDRVNGQMLRIHFGAYMFNSNVCTFHDVDRTQITLNDEGSFFRHAYNVRPANTAGAFPTFEYTSTHMGVVAIPDSLGHREVIANPNWSEWDMPTDYFSFPDPPPIPPISLPIEINNLFTRYRYDDRPEVKGVNTDFAFPDFHQSATTGTNNFGTVRISTGSGRRVRLPWQHLYLLGTPGPDLDTLVDILSRFGAATGFQLTDEIRSHIQDAFPNNLYRL
jgi:hypothetical protein